MAAAKGYADAQYNLGVAYDSGFGVREDRKEAANWYLLAAEKGNPLAQYSLGNLAAKGQGMRRDYVEAYKWFAVAASRFTTAENDLREQATKSRDDAAAKLSRADLAEGEKRVREWMPN